MVNDKINISSIETFFNSILDNKVSDNTFFGNAPTFDSSWTDMLVVDCGNAISDMNAYGKGIVLLYLYAKPMSSGKKNVAVFDTLEKKLNNVLNSVNDATYRISRRNTYADYDTANKIHFNVVEINLLIL